MTDNNPAVRVRMAPGPTGPFHIGRSRTALINWLFARHHGGAFVLRIEDTDQKRSRPEHLQSILDSLRWLGMDWDEGPDVGGPYAPYFQMGRLDSYREYADRLLANGHAYRCYCTPEELDALRAQAQAERRPFRYPGVCRHLSAADRQEIEGSGKGWVLRLAVDHQGQTTFSDLILGAVTVQNDQIDDFVIVKSDGIPTYNFAVVIDDLTMKISHVIRGQDHVPNTPKQIVIYQYLNEPLPLFAHPPLVVGLEGAKISARHGAEGANVWGTTRGYLPEAVVNYLGTIGVSYEEGRDLFSTEDMIRLFTLDKVGRSQPKSDEEKLDWFNGQYIRALPLDEFVKKCLPFLELRGLLSTPPTPQQLERATAALALEQERIRSLAEAPDAVEFFMVDDLNYDPGLLVVKKSTPEDARRVLGASLKAIGAIGRFSTDQLEECFRSLAVELGLKPGIVFGTIRVAITGRIAAPPLFDTMVALGADLVTARLERAQEYMRAYGHSLE
ncbi:MAG: glutamate--tRNA ligase [Chloroflexota bacterium]